MAWHPRRQSANRGGLDAWPGYVDALSTLLMAIIFVLLVFVLAQGFLSTALSSRDESLKRLNQRVAELADMLALEQGRASDSEQSLQRNADELRRAVAARNDAAQRVQLLQTELGTLRSEREKAIGENTDLASRFADLRSDNRSATDRLVAAERRVAEAEGLAEAANLEAAVVAGRLTQAERLLAAERTARGLAETRAIQAERRSEAMRLADAERSAEAQAQRQRSAAEQQRTRDEQTARAAAERRAEAAEQRGNATSAQLDTERARLALLERQLAELQSQLATIAAALEVARVDGREKEVRIQSLGQQINIALATKVEELQRYRSNFFGRLKELLGDRPDVKVVGDRFVVQSDLLFPQGSAEISESGAQQLASVARLIVDIAGQIPPDVNWILRVDGHADRVPARSRRFANNWQLSAARAIAVAQRLISEGVPANRIAAAAFGDQQPVDPGDTAEALARNRRIELRLTDR